MDAATITSFIKDAGAIGALVLVLVMIITKQLVPRWYTERLEADNLELKADKQYWQDRTFEALGVARTSVSVANEVVKKDTRRGAGR